MKREGEGRRFLSRHFGKGFFGDDEILLGALFIHLAMVFGAWHSKA